MDLLSAEHYWLARWLFEKSLALLYFVAFLSAGNQFPALLGERGLLPAPEFLRRVRFREAPSLFHWHYSDRLLRLTTAGGMMLSLGVVAGLFERVPLAAHLGVWLSIWWLYLSIVNVGQRFYGFGWESMLCEAGFFAAFLGPSGVAPSWIPLVILSWMLFRVEIGAGLIKLRHDEAWRDLTALDYHHETQPLPNPLSWYFHRLPRVVLRGGVVFSHAVQVVAPFGLFAPQPVAGIAAGLIILHQLALIVAGNYSWLNWLTVVLALLAFSNAQLSVVAFFPSPPEVLAARPPWFELLLVLLAAGTAALSVRPLANLFSRRQLMNYCWNPWHLVCAYGAFGSMTRKRYEVVVEGTADGTSWREYGFRAKPGEPGRRPPQVAPYHLRLDWLMWFLPFSVTVSAGGLHVQAYERWLIRFVERLLEGDRAMLLLLRHNPFPDAPPRMIRARYYLYRFTDRARRRATGDWWSRELIGDFLPPVSLSAEGALVRGQVEASHWPA